MLVAAREAADAALAEFNGREPVDDSSAGADGIDGCDSFSPVDALPSRPDLC